MTRLTPDDFQLAWQSYEDMATTVSEQKYQMRDQAGNLVEHSFHEVLARVAAYYQAHAPHDPATVADVTEMLTGTGEFVPAGSILSGAGNDALRASFSNCYLTPIEHDSLEAIYDCLKKLARTYSLRGGSGTSLNVLRPAGAKVNNAARTSSGAVSFMPLVSEGAASTGQNGRRAAVLISLGIWHPDALKFIWCKARPEEVFTPDEFTGRLPDISKANISLEVSNAFMQAVDEDADWDFIFPDFEAVQDVYEREWDGDIEKWRNAGRPVKVYQTMPAREVLAQIAEAAWTCGDPGLLYLDTAQSLAPGTYVHESLKPRGSNPCGEQLLGFYNNCLLGALVLPRFVRDPWTKDARFDGKRFRAAVRLGVCFLDVISSQNQALHPLPEQREADRFGKRIGLELTGLGDVFAMLGLRYGSPESIAFGRELMRAKAEAEILASLELAENYGCCPALKSVKARERLLDSPYFTHLLAGMNDVADRLPLDGPAALRDRIRKSGLRNTAWSTIGPCGSISLMVGNCTSGIEPVYAFAYTRKTRLADKEFAFLHSPVVRHILDQGLQDKYAGLTVEELKTAFGYVEAAEVAPLERVALQSALQEFCDASISSTVNLPATATVREIQAIYERAWEFGCKGITVFRDGCKKGVLAKVADDAVDPAMGTPPEIIIRELLDVERCERHRVLWKGAKLYVIVSLDEEDQPVEVFAKLPREAGINGGGVYNEQVYQEKFSLWESTTRLVSLLLRTGMPLEMVLKQLDKSSYSLVDAGSVLARVLRRYLPEPEEDDQEIVAQGLGAECPECHEAALVYENGCNHCKACGYSKCG